MKENIDNETGEIITENKSTNAIEDLTEGKLYKLVNGELEELVLDPNELRKVKITDDAIKAATLVQKQMRKALDGFKPDITTVCSAFIKAQAEKPDAATVVSSYWLEKAQTAVSAVSAES